ncbi:MAG: hypothetical protein ABIJ48_01780 [Actinomycetota bacterium]
MTVERACGVILLDPRRLRRWLHRAGAAWSVLPSSGERAAVAARPNPAILRAADLADRPPVACRLPQRLTGTERGEILGAADEERLAHLRHRKLCHTLSREGRVWVSEWSRPAVWCK